ncbi:MAG: ferritin-like domain-containing protein [Candidatus Promineofilum sp.]|nr:ferritin-like domain-containing protein [Promineifilum sp.]
MKIQSMEDLMVHELQDLRSAEEQLVEALPKMAAAANSAQLKKAFNDHLKQTKTHLTRAEKALEHLGKGPGNMKCKGMEGLVKEGDEAIKDVTDPETLDAALIGAAQRVEHYEIAGYGTARAHAEELGLTEIADLLQLTLDEEGEANKLMTQIAEGRMTSGVNERAAVR